MRNTYTLVAIIIVIIVGGLVFMRMGKKAEAPIVNTQDVVIGGNTDTATAGTMKVE